MEAKRLTPKSHMIVDSYGNRLGLTFQQKDGSVLFTYDKEIYPSIETIAKKLKEKCVFTELPVEQAVINDIDGYPIKHDVVFQNDLHEWNDKNIITYITRQNSTVKFCAGWWVIATENMLRLSLSPKLSTINDNCVGPFKDKFECQAELNRMNNERLSQS